MIIHFIMFIIATLLLLSILTYYGVIFKNSKYRSILTNKLTISVIKKIIYAYFSLLLISLIIFLLTEIMPNQYFENSSMNTVVENDNKNLFPKLLEYFYNILPIPKKTCSTTILENNTLICSTYKYQLFDFGISNKYMKNVPVLVIIKEKCLISFFIGIIAYTLQCVIGYPLGIYLAKKENKFIDKSYNILNLIIKIIPTVLYFYLFVILFMVVFKMPVLFDSNNILTYIPPLTALTICSSLSIAYFVRKYILIEMNKDYVKFAISKGLDKNTILYKHVLKNAILPFIRTIPASILTCFCGFYILEASFNIPGIGLTFIYAIQLKDIDLIRGLIFFFSFLSISAHLIGDILTIIFSKKLSLYKEEIENERK